MTILELREKRAKAWETCKSFLDSHRSESGTLSAEDDATYTRMEADVASLGKEVSRMERQEALDAELKKAVSAPLTSKPEAMKADSKAGKASDLYRSAFWNRMKTRAIVTPEMINALQEGTDSEGGYLVPDEFERTLIKALDEANAIRALSHAFTTSSGSHKIPVVASSGSASWIDEEGAITESDESFGQVQIDAHKLGTRIKLSEELLNDSAFDLEGYFTESFAERFAKAEEDAFLNGNGSGKPTGILNATGGASAGVTAAAVAAIAADELIDLFYSLKTPYRRNAVWVLNDSTVKAVRKLKDGNGQYLWQPALRDGEFDSILGKRIVTSAYMPALASSAKTVAFGDFSYYWIGDRQGITFKRLNELYAENGQVGFIATKRLDAKLVLAEAVKVLQMKA
jgi:HK97 family phage major capsid protein